MGRGLSDQQRRILALAVAHNAARRDGVPTPQTFTMDARPGYVDADGHRLACRVAYAPEIPDITEQFVLATLYGFRVRRGWIDHSGFFNHYVPSTVKPGKRVSVRRALRSLVDRGYLVDAWCAGWMRSVGYLEQDYKNAERIEHEKHGKTVEHFWHEGSWGAMAYARAYWLTPAAFEIVGNRWVDFFDEVDFEVFADASGVREVRGDPPPWWAAPVVIDAEPARPTPRPVVVVDEPLEADPVLEELADIGERLRRVSDSMKPRAEAVT